MVTEPVIHMYSNRLHRQMSHTRNEVKTASVLAPKALLQLVSKKKIFTVVPIGMRKICITPHRSFLFTTSLSVK